MLTSWNEPKSCVGSVVPALATSARTGTLCLEWGNEIKNRNWATRRLLIFAVFLMIFAVLFTIVPYLKWQG
jgi:hypothetical protein